MADRARVLVHGATGFTGKLVCAALRRRRIAFGVSGRNAAKLDGLVRAAGASDACVVDVNAAATIRDAVAGRAIVCACAGPFAEVGEPVLATCARSGVHYVDTTGEQGFVANAVARYLATAEASGACVVPAMAYEIALADWGAHLASGKVGGTPDAITITYASPSAGATRGTKKSALGVIASGASKQFVDGKLVDERVAAFVSRVSLRGRADRVTAVSFPSPEAVVVPSHTGAKTVRTFMTTGAMTARALHLGGRAVPALARFARGGLEKLIDRAAPGPDEATRGDAGFHIVCEATKGTARAEVVVTGRDPYGLTAELQAYAVLCALEGGLLARGVVAPSVAFDAIRGLEAMGEFGVSVTQ